MKNVNEIIIYIIIIIAPLCWAGDVVLAKSLSSGVPPFTLAFWRWFSAFLILLPFAYNHLKKDWHIIKKHWKMLYLLSILGMSAFISLIYTAVKTTTAINTAIIQTSIPAAIILFCFILYKEKISINQIIGLILCILGAIYVVLQGKIHGLLNMSFVRGDIFMIIASIMYGLYSTLLQKIPKINTLTFLTVTSGLGAITLLPLYSYDIISNEILDINLKLILGILYVAIFPSIIAYLCWTKGINTLGANKTGIFITLTPVFASILAIIFLGENIKGFHIIGMLIILIGMTLFTKYSRIK